MTGEMRRVHESLRSAGHETLTAGELRVLVGCLLTADGNGLVRIRSVAEFLDHLQPQSGWVFKVFRRFAGLGLLRAVSNGKVQVHTRYLVNCSLAATEPAVRPS